MHFLLQKALSLTIYHYDVIGVKGGTKWRKYMKTCMFFVNLPFSAYIHVGFTPHYIIMVKGLLHNHDMFLTCADSITLKIV